MAVKTLPSCTGGWNARDSMDDMPAVDAISLINWIPESGYLRSRGGTKLHVDLNDDCKTLVEYHSGSARKFLACAGGKVIDITNPSNTVILKSGLTGDSWQTVQHGTKLVFVNGSDVPQTFDGSIVTDTVFSGTTWGSSSASNFVGCISFKGRVIYWEKDSSKVWVAAAGSYQGQLSPIDLGLIASKGGNVINVFSWTLDAGDGVNDLAVFVFSSGETLVYKGDDPTNANAWALVGKFNLGQPVSYRGHARLANDEILITKDGYQNISSAIRSARSDNKNISNKITRAAQEATNRYSGNKGWQAFYYPKGKLFIVNVPISTSSIEQHVLNTNTMQWTKFSGWGAAHFCTFNDELYFCSGSKIYHADTGVTDNGSAITLHCIPAFHHLAGRARNAQLSGIQIVSNYQYPENIGIEPTSNYQKPLTPRIITIAHETGASWGDDWGASWSMGDSDVSGYWHSINEYGFAVSAYVLMQTKSQQIKWFSTAYMFNDGGEI